MKASFTSGDLTLTVESTFRRDTSISYTVIESGITILSGDDLRTPAGMSSTPIESAAALAGFLSAYGEHFDRLNHSPEECPEGWCGEYDADTRKWLADHHDEFSLLENELEEMLP